MIQTSAKDAQRSSPMRLERNRVQCVLPLSDGMCPDESNRQESQEFPDLHRIGHVRVFEAKASRLEAAEERLDLPSLEVGLDGIGAWDVAHDNHVLVRKTGAGKEEPHPADDACVVERAHLSLGQSPEQIADVVLLAAWETEVLPDADAERDLLFLEPGKPCMPHELPISEKTGDVLLSEQRDYCPQNGLPLLRVRVPLLPEKHPGNRESSTLVDDGDREDVDVAFPPLPVRPVHREPVRSRRKQGEYELHQELLRNLERRKEPLDAAVTGIRRRFPAKGQSDLREVHGPYRDERKNELGEEFETLTPEREMNTQCVREGLNRPFLEVGFMGSWGKSLKGATS